MRLEKISHLLADQISGEWGSEGNEIAILRTTNFTNKGRLDFTDVVYRNVSKDKIRKKALRIGDTIIEKSGGSPTQPVGRVVYFDAADQTYLCNNFTSILRPSKDVDSRFFFWMLFANHAFNRTLKYQNKTTGIINLKLERYLEETRIPIPPLPTQKKIAAILDKADSLRQKDKQVLEHYHQLAQSIFYNTFGDPSTNTKKWKKIEFGSVVEFPSSLIDPTKLPYSKMLHVGGDNIATDGAIIGLKTAQELGLRSGKFLFDESHILYNKIRPYLNKVATPNFSGLCSADMYPLKPGKDITREFLYNILRSDDFLNFAAKQSRRANIPKINREELSSYKMIVPDLSLQKQFSGMFLTIQGSKAIAVESSSKSELLFQSFLQKAFNGELVNGD